MYARIIASNWTYRAAGLPSYCGRPFPVLLYKVGAIIGAERRQISQQCPTYEDRFGNPLPVNNWPQERCNLLEDSVTKAELLLWAKYPR